jgi:hypothetical protein
MQCDAIGMPNIRFKLPSRNWMIFFTITGSFNLRPSGEAPLTTEMV